MTHAPDPEDGKIVDPEALAKGLLDAADDHAALLEAIVAPTADDLLALTLSALEDVQGSLTLTDQQRAALAAALRERLLGEVVRR